MISMISMNPMISKTPQSYFDKFGALRRLLALFFKNIGPFPKNVGDFPKNVGDFWIFLGHFLTNLGENPNNQGLTCNLPLNSSPPSDTIPETNQQRGKVISDKRN